MNEEGLNKDQEPVAEMKELEILQQIVVKEAELQEVATQADNKNNDAEKMKPVESAVETKKRLPLPMLSKVLR